jgi:hypothetical protein
MANDTYLNTPILWINKYLQDKIELLTNIGRVPFFPTQPSTLDSLTQSFPTGDVMATYDRMFKMNRSGFPHIKCEQALYYFYATADTSVEKMIQITEAVYRLLDRGDESAEEINNWCSNRRIDLGGTEGLVDNMFYFHDFKVYQLEETRDIIDFGTARTYAGNKIIIDFDYHQMPDLTNASWTPEANLSGNNKITI